MSPRTKIALLRPVDPGLASLLSGVLHGVAATPEVQTFQDLFRDAAAIVDFSPALVIARHDASFAQTLGGLRVIRALRPEIQVILICDPSPDLALTEMAKEQAIQLLPEPFTNEQLTTCLRLAQIGGAAEPNLGFVEFAQGICDEINNPLQAATGHLRLLQTRLDASEDDSLLGQVRAIREGLTRISGTMRKVANMSRAADGDRSDSSFTLGSLLDEIAEALREAGLPVVPHCADEAQRFVLQGDLALLRGAIINLVQVGCDLSDDAAQVQLNVGRCDGGVQFRMRVTDSRLERWELPQVFEPYQLNHVLRGSNHGLNLFLVRVIARSHGGDAVARRISDRGVEFLFGIAAAE